MVSWSMRFPWVMAVEYFCIKSIEQNEADIDRTERTCIVSKSWTNLRSVSTISRTRLFRKDSCALAAGIGGNSTSESDDSCAESKGGEGGESSKASWGR